MSIWTQFLYMRIFLHGAASSLGDLLTGLGWIQPQGSSEYHHRDVSDSTAQPGGEDLWINVRPVGGFAAILALLAKLPSTRKVTVVAKAEEPAPPRSGSSKKAAAKSEASAPPRVEDRPVLTELDVRVPMANLDDIKLAALKTAIGKGPIKYDEDSGRHRFFSDEPIQLAVATSFLQTLAAQLGQGTTSPAATEKATGA